MEESTRPTIVALARSLLADLRGLVAQELQLAKHEMQHELSKLVKASILADVETVALLSLIAVILVGLTLVYLLHSVHGGVVAIIAAAGAVGLGYAVMKLGPTLRLWPFRTLRTLKEDARWTKEQVLSPKT